jgi:hypothetical protein
LLEIVMSLLFLILVLLGALLWRTASAAWRLWDQLPRRNADFGLVPGDLGGRP